jgi:hypothetical protein
MNFCIICPCWKNHIEELEINKRINTSHSNQEGNEIKIPQLKLVMQTRQQANSADKAYHYNL